MKTIRLFAKYAVVIMISFMGLLLEANAKDGKPFPEFFNGLYNRHISDFKTAHENDYRIFCEGYNIAPNNPANQEKYFRLLFYHKMFTGSNSYDCARGGMLKIPYFWHWIEPNPRHEIIDNQTGKLLTGKKPPEGFSQYKSHADIDRIPSIYLKDLVSEEPKYRHPDCSEFYTFGWCSEREMSFSLFMGLYGYKSKVIQEGIHVTSDFWLAFTDRTGVETRVMAIVDNTYDTIVWKRVGGIGFDTWYNDMGDIKFVEWYSSKARSNQERESVRNIHVGSKAAARIEGLVN